MEGHLELWRTTLVTDAHTRMRKRAHTQTRLGQLPLTQVRLRNIGETYWNVGTPPNRRCSSTE